MKKKTLCFQFKNGERKFLFEDKVFVIEDKKLIDELDKPAYKNVESDLFIKSSNIYISDVVQIKVNLFETGYFLISFVRESLNEEKRKILLDEISALKNNTAQTNSTQLTKAKKLVEILNKYHPLFATFVNDGIYDVNITKLSHEELKFPILVISKKQKKHLIKIGFHKPNRKISDHKSYEPFPLFTLEYMFILLFSFLGSFGITTGIYEAMNKQGISIFLFLLGAAFVVILVVAMQSAIYKKGHRKNPFLRYYLAIFILLGIAGGVTGGYFISKYIFKTELTDLNYSKFIVLSIIISSILLLSSVFTSILANIFIKKREELKKK